MITTKKKVGAIILFILVGLFAAAFSLFRPQKEEGRIETVSELSGSTLGGMISGMSDTSAWIFFESILGVRLSGYSSSGNMDELLYALSSGRVLAVWVPDVTAAWLLRTRDGFRELKTPEPERERFWFALALKPEQEALRDQMNEALRSLKETKTLAQLAATYLTAAEEPDPFYPEDMTVHSREFDTDRTIYIGVTGAAPPIDLLDEEDRPYGFSVALMDEIGQAVGAKVRFVTLSNESAFSSLRSGRVDALFCWGSGESTLDPGAVDKKKEYITTEGYYPMSKYAFLTLD